MSDSVSEIDPGNAAAFRQWLQANHARAPSVWVVLWKQSSGRQALTLGEAIDQALCFGWIDSKSQSLDQDRYRVYFSIRKPASGWSRINKDKIARLTRTGAMAPAGHATIQRAKDDGSWTMLDDPEAGIVPPDLATALDEAGAQDGFDALAPGARKAVLTWLVTAKRNTTRADRIAKTVAAATEGRSPLT